MEEQVTTKIERLELPEDAGNGIIVQKENESVIIASEKRTETVLTNQNEENASNLKEPHETVDDCEEQEQITVEHPDTSTQSISIDTAKPMTSNNRQYIHEEDLDNEIANVAEDDMNIEDQEVSIRRLSNEYM